MLICLRLQFVLCTFPIVECSKLRQCTEAWAEFEDMVGRAFHPFAWSQRPRHLTTTLISTNESFDACREGSAHLEFGTLCQLGVFCLDCKCQHEQILGQHKSIHVGGVPGVKQPWHWFQTTSKQSRFSPPGPL